VQPSIDQRGLAIGFQWAFFDFQGEVRITCPGANGHLFDARAVLHPGNQIMDWFKQGIREEARQAAGNTVDQVYKDMQQAIRDFEGTELSVGGLRDSLPPLCDKIIKTIRSAIVDNTGGIKKVAREEALNQAAPFIKRVKAVAAAARASGDDAFRKDLKAALQALVDNNHLKVTVKVAWESFTVYNGKPIAGSNLSNLKRAIGLIDKLRASSSLKAQNIDRYASFPERSRILAEVNNGVEASIPEIHSLAFETSLGALSPEKMAVDITYGIGKEKTRTVSAELDFTDPVGLSKALVKVF